MSGLLVVFTLFTYSVAVTFVSLPHVWVNPEHLLCINRGGVAKGVD